MITRRLSIILGVATATVGGALLAPLAGAMARGGGSGTTNGSFPTGPNQNVNGGNGSSGSSGSGSKNGSFPTGPNQNINGGNSGNRGRTPPGGHGLPPRSGSGGGGEPLNGGGPGPPGQ